MKHAIKHIHFIGVGGAGMSAIAEVLHGQGLRVSGSDQSDSAVTRRLAQLGLAIFIGHDARHIAGAQAVVTSTAVQPDNPEVVAARAARIPVVARAVLLAELMRLKQGVAIAGTHGKTTTTSLVASVLAEAGLDPTFVIGGQLKSAGANARLGSGDWIVVEADESDASFLHLSPVISVVTNIDADHMETYGHDIGRLHSAFVDFIHRLPFYGRAVLCSDDAGVQAVLPRLQRPVTTYGLAVGADLRAIDVQALPGGRMHFTAQQARHADLRLTLNLAGRHNVCNALAALAVARELQAPDEASAQALQHFAGVGRRFECLGDVPCDGGHYTLIDDYGHHPVEMAAVLEAARGAYPGRRVLLAFQPHRYTRTRDCFDGFVTVLQQADGVLLCPVYAAGEATIVGADSAALAAAVPRAVLVDSIAALPAAIARQAHNGDVVITLGAGSIGQVPRQLMDTAGASA
ncbi:MAG: UDP-N-acetylmuramate--L-alanine ligase [Rubrivivax sp.]|nr:UDP-N-acetylmuramate--L-alanine ligase [Rubrivivax sp.]